MHHNFAPLDLFLQGLSVARVFRVQLPRVLELAFDRLIKPATQEVKLRLFLELGDIKRRHEAAVAVPFRDRVYRLGMLYFMVFTIVDEESVQRLAHINLCDFWFFLPNTCSTLDVGRVKEICEH